MTHPWCTNRIIPYCWSRWRLTVCCRWTSMSPRIRNTVRIPRWNRRTSTCKTYRSLCLWIRIRTWPISMGRNSRWMFWVGRTVEHAKCASSPRAPPSLYLSSCAGFPGPEPKKDAATSCSVRRTGARSYSGRNKCRPWLWSPWRAEEWILIRQWGWQYGCWSIVSNCKCMRVAQSKKSNKKWKSSSKTPGLATDRLRAKAEPVVFGRIQQYRWSI